MLPFYDAMEQVMKHSKHISKHFRRSVLLAAIAAWGSLIHILGRSGHLRPQLPALSLHTSSFESGRLLDTSWSSDPMMSQIKTDLLLPYDVHVYVVPFKPDSDPAEGNIMDYLMLGLLEHPRVVLVNESSQADVFLCISHKSNMSAMGLYGSEAGTTQDDNLDWARVVVIDEGDSPFGYGEMGEYADGRYLAYFKRSMVGKHHSKVQDRKINEEGPRDLPYSYWPFRQRQFPFPYAITNRYLRAMHTAETLMQYDDGAARNISVACLLRNHPSTWDGARKTVMEHLSKMQLPNAVIGGADDGNREVGGQIYWGVLQRTQILVNANPGNWEGDYRLWEALASKALVFVDYMYAPHPNALIDGEDIIFYNPSNMADLERKVRYFLQNPQEARRIAMSGYYKALRFHRYVNRIDYIFSTAALLLEPIYKTSGMALMREFMNTNEHFFRQKPPTKKYYQELRLRRTSKGLAADGPDRQISQEDAAKLRARLADKVNGFGSWEWELQGK